MTARDYYNKRLNEDNTIGSIQLMEEYAKIKSAKFIPVNEELPNTEEQVLIKIESGSATYNDRKAVCDFLTAAIDEHGNWYDWQCDENINNTVISWLRLSDL